MKNLNLDLDLDHTDPNRNHYGSSWIQSEYWIINHESLKCPTQISANTLLHRFYMSYVQLNPALTRPTMYSRYVPTTKLHKTSQLRMISHDLKIEVGRHRRPVVPKEERLCVCGSVESETHFLFECQMYYHIRCKYNISVNELSKVLDETFTCDYVNDLFNCRKIFMDI